MLRCVLLFTLAFACGCLPQQHMQAKRDGDQPLVTTASGLQYRILKPGTGDEVKPGHEVLLFETATYRNGTLLYSNENSDQPIKVRVGAHQATDGEDEGLRGMKEGEIRFMIIPPYLCRRASYPPNLSPDSTICVKVILYKIIRS